VIFSCSGCKLLPLLELHRRQMSGAFLSVPSPEQGTSQRMRSKERMPWRSCLALVRGLTIGKS
jgi:hypothetical protein